MTQSATLLRAARGAPLAPHLAGLAELARSLHEEGRTKDALLLFEHLAAANPDDVETLRQLVRLLGNEGRTLEALEKLSALKRVMTDAEALLCEIQGQILPALDCFNNRLAAGEVEEAEKYAAALVALVPRNTALLNAALSCNLVLGRKERAATHATTLLSLDASHEAARAALADSSNRDNDAEGEIAHRMALALSPRSDVHPLIRLRDMHDVASAILCRPLTNSGAQQIQLLLNAGRELSVGVPSGSEWEGWEKHYRLMLDAIDLAAVLGATPEIAAEPETLPMTSSGASLDWPRLRATAARIEAKTVFFAAADRTYIDLYARWYIKSILKYCDVPCLIILHVVGGAGCLREVSKSLRIRDKRLIFTGDDFDPEAVTTRCFDAPPKGRIAKPAAHLQSIRFLKLGSLLKTLKLPVFVSDIDLILQRGVKDLLERSSNADVVFNENTISTNAGSRLTANLLLVNPTNNAELFLRFLRSYLERELNKPEVSRWIDQFALLMARHHLSLRTNNPRIEYFDTRSDINNVMYTSYQEHPFRFLSLYHGFDTSSLKDHPNALGEEKKRTRLARRAKPAIARGKRPPKSATKV